MAAAPPSPSASSVLLPHLGGKPRRGSLTSLSPAKGELDKDVLSQALDTIHTTASKSETLTSFHDFDGGAPRSGAKEIVSSGISGLYDKYIRGLTVSTPVKESRDRPRTSASKESVESASIHSAGSRNAHWSAVKTTANDSASVRSARSNPSNNETPQPEVAPYESKSSSRKRPSDRNEQLPLTVDPGTSSSKTPEGKPFRNVHDAPRQTDHARGRELTVDTGRSDTASETLARVLSQHEPPIADDPKKPRSLHPSSGIGQTNEDSNVAGSTLRSPSAPPTAPTDDKIKLEDPKDKHLLQGQSLRPPMTHAGVSHLPGYEPSRASSTDGGDAASVSSSRTGLRARLDPSPNLNTGLRSGNVEALPTGSQSLPLENVPQQLKRRVISKAFWMKDENAKDCFYCGQAFSTFRRKHHCRTCGQIFDAKCTSLVQGRPFGQPGTIRLCKPCEAMICGSDDDSTVFSDDASEFRRTPVARRTTGDDHQLPGFMDGVEEDDGDVAEVATPSIGIPASRRNREAKRRSAVIEFDAAPSLPRPTSSHSLISLARRPRSSSHRRHHSRHQNVRGWRGPADERGPFQPTVLDDTGKTSSLPAFHNDNIIDPDLAPFASDEGSDDEEQPSILSTMNGGNSASLGDRDRVASGIFSATIKKGRSKHVAASSVRDFKEDDALMQATRHLPKLSRNRNLSQGSMSYGRPSPLRSSTLR